MSKYYKINDNLVIDKQGFKNPRKELYPLNEDLIPTIQTWIENNLKKRVSLNQNTDSYKLKHICERQIGQYVGNGELIVAMIQAGYKFDNGGLNASFNIDSTIYKNLVEKDLNTKY